MNHIRDITRESKDGGRVWENTRPGTTLRRGSVKRVKRMGFPGLNGEGGMVTKGGRFEVQCHET